MANLINLDKLSDEVRKIIEPYCDRMIEIHEENLKSISLYGSAAGDDFVAGKSNINVLAVMERIDPPDLKKSLKLVESGRKKGIVAPLLITMEHIRTSTDTFPVEFLEMKENYRLVYGKDVLKDLSISPKNIRLQCEQQIKGGLIRLYQVYLEIGMKEKRIKELMINSLGSLIPVFRNILRLKGMEVSVRKLEIVNAVSEAFSLNRELLQNILKMKKGIKVDESIEAMFGDYLEEIEKLGIEVDRMKV